MPAELGENVLPDSVNWQQNVGANLRKSVNFANLLPQQRFVFALFAQYMCRFLCNVWLK